MKIVIIGGGIGGLALANAFEILDIGNHLFERAKAFTEVGAGIGISESGIEILNRFGFKNRLLEEGKKVPYAKIADKKLNLIRSIPAESGRIPGKDLNSSL